MRLPMLFSISVDVLQVHEGALYPALQRMLINTRDGNRKMGITAGNRRARYDQLTTSGRKPLGSKFRNLNG